MSDYQDDPIDEIEEEQEQDDRGDDVDPELAELEDDLDESEESAVEESEESEPEKASKPRMVPHSRFNEVNDALKAERESRLRLEEELARARGAQPQPEQKPAQAQEQPQPYDFDAAEDRYMEAVMEGDTATARQIRGEIRAQERAEAERTALQVVEARRAEEDQARQQQTLKQTAAELYKRYPQLNGQSADADPDMIEMTLALRNKYISAGDTPADALKKAALKVCGDGQLIDEDEVDEDDTPRRRIARNLQRESRIPPRELGAGERSRPTDYSSLSDDEFAALPEAEKRKARGDFL